MTTGGRHPGQSASFKAHRAACPRARANCAAFGRTQGLPAWSSADGGPPAALAAACTGSHAPMAADGHHLGQHAAAHADPQGLGKLRLDARGRLRGKGVDNEG